jgi:hypothetical protein
MTRLTIDSRRDCYLLDPARMEALQSGKNSLALALGSYEIRIQSGDFSYWSGSDRDFPPEPWVMLWIYGGTVINRQTDLAVGCTWSSLNGYDDCLMLQVLEPARISALFFDTHVQDNQGIVRLSVQKI